MMEHLLEDFGVTPIIDEISNVARMVDTTVLQVTKENESNFGPITNALEQKVRGSVGLEKFHELLSKLKAPQERVFFVQEFYNWIPIRPQTLKKYEKDPVASKALRDKGNEFFKSGVYEDALESYNLAVMFARPEGEELGLAIANRSAVLVEMSDPRGALEDIDLALKSNYPESLSSKLTQRSERCENMVQKSKEDVRKIDRGLRAKVEAEWKLRKRIHDKMFTIENPNPLMPSAADFVKISFDENKGRHLTVSRDVAVGSVIAVEDPYVALLYNEVDWDTKHCHCCLKRIRRGIPCKTCVFALYCDESCLEKARKEYHGFECRAMSYMHLNSMSTHSQQALRIVCKVGPEELFRIFSTQDPNFFDLKGPFGIEPGCKYDSDSYLTMYHIKTYADSRDNEFRYWSTRQAFVLGSILEVQTDFFNKIPLDRKDEFKKFVTALLLRHIESSRVNTEVVHDIEGLDDTPLQDFYDPRKNIEEVSLKIENEMSFVRFGAAIYPVFSLLNHSCDGNVCTLNDDGSGKLIIIAARTIIKGEEILTCYGNGFSNEPRVSRQAQLLKDFNLTCKCIACRYNWPLLDSMLMAYSLSGNVPFCCPKCSRKFFQEDKESPEFLKCCLRGSLWKCRLCQTRYNELELQRMFKFNSEMSEEALHLALKNRPREALEKMKRSLDFFQFHVRPPFPIEYMNQVTYMKSFSLIFYYAKQVNDIVA